MNQDPAALLPARIVSASDEGRYRLLSVRLDDPAAHRAGVAAHRRSGQFVFLAAVAGEAANPYALVDPPGPDRDRPFRFLLRSEPGVAEALVAAGEGPLYAGQPQGPGFAVEAAERRHVVLFAAGSGIAPIHALADQLSARGRPITLYYGEEREAAFAFRDRLAVLAGRGVRVVLTASAGEPDWAGARGWVQQVAAADAAAWRPDGTVVYVCGMAEMEAAVRRLAAQRGIPADLVLTNVPGQGSDRAEEAL